MPPSKLFKLWCRCNMYLPISCFTHLPVLNKVLHYHFKQCYLLKHPHQKFGSLNLPKPTFGISEVSKISGLISHINFHSSSMLLSVVYPTPYLAHHLFSEILNSDSWNAIRDHVSHSKKTWRKNDWPINLTVSREEFECHCHCNVIS